MTTMTQNDPFGTLHDDAGKVQYQIEFLKGQLAQLNAQINEVHKKLFEAKQAEAPAPSAV